MLQNGKLMPNLDFKTTKALNLTVLQRIDPFVEEILMTAAHVTLYDFDIDANQWSRKDVEGFSFRREKLNSLPECSTTVPIYSNESSEQRILNAYSKVPTNSKVSSAKSDFEEVEAVPASAVVDGHLEPPSSTIANVSDNSDDPSFVNFVTTAMNVGGAPNSAVSALPYHSSTNVISTRPTNVVSADSPALATTTWASSNISTAAPMIIPNSTEPNATAKHSADLVKPSSFFSPTPSTSPLVIPPVSSSISTPPPLSPPGGVQRPNGAPLLHPFPPPAPPQSLTPTSVPTVNYLPAISREKVQEALHILVQDNQFVDMVYRAMVNVNANSHQQ